MAGDFDQASRWLVTADPGPFVGWLLGLPQGTYRFLRWLDARRVRFPGEPDRTCDTVAWLEDVSTGGVPWAVPVEFQYSPDPAMFGRLLGYLGTLWLEERPADLRGDRFQVGAVVVNLTGRGRSGRHCEWPVAGLATVLSVAERNLEAEDAAAVVTGVASGTVPAVVLPLVPLMQGGDDPATAIAWDERMKALPPGQNRAALAALTQVFAGATGREALWESVTMGWDVLKSSVVESWRASARAEGEARGRAEGEARGRAEGAIATILRLLGKRFGPLPEDLIAALTAVQDEGHLDRLADAVVPAGSLDEFRTLAGL